MIVTIEKDLDLFHLADKVADDVFERTCDMLSIEENEISAKEFTLVLHGVAEILLKNYNEENVMTKKDYWR